MSVSVPSLSYNIRWTMIGNLTLAAAKWLLMVMFAKYLSSEDVGRFALGLAISAPLIAFTNMQLRGVQATDVGDGFWYKDYFMFRYLSVIVTLFLVAIAAMVATNTMHAFWIVVAVGVWKCVEALSDIIFGYFQKHEKMKLIATSLIIKGILSVAVVGISLALYAELLVSIIVLLLAWVVVLLLYDLRSFLSLSDMCVEERRTDSSADMGTMWKMVVLVFPMGIVVLFHNLNLNIPKYFISAELGESQLGIFAAISYIIVAGTTVVGAVGQSSLPRLAKLWQSDHTSFKRLVSKILTMVASIGVAGVLISYVIGEEILALLYTDEYTDYNDVFVFTMIGAAFLYMTSIGGCVLTAMRKFADQSKILFLSMVSTLIASMFLVPDYGLIGAACASMIGFIVSFVLELYLIIKFTRVQSYG